MKTCFNKGAIMRVCGGLFEIHGFHDGDLVRVLKVRKDPQLAYVALCERLNDSRVEVLLINEVEDL